MLQKLNRRRWIAILVAVVLVFMSIGFRFTMTVASGLLEDVFNFETSYFEEEEIRPGDIGEKIAILQLNGAIMDLSSPLFMDGYNHELFLATIDQAFEDPDVEAVILSVDSPGGAVGETAQIHKKLINYMEEYEKPFYVSMGSMAASGGYYVAAPADKIFAEPSTITGSIGVIMQNINYSGLAEKYGVDFNTIKSGKHKDIMSPSREMTEDEQAIMQSIIDEMYSDFVQVIVDGRNLDEEKVREIGDGRIYTGRQAQELGLVDEIGDLDATIDAMMDEYDLEDAQVIQYSTEISIFSNFAMSVQQFLQKPTEFDLVSLLLNESDKPRAMYIY